MQPHGAAGRRPARRLAHHAAARSSCAQEPVDLAAVIERSGRDQPPADRGRRAHASIGGACAAARSGVDGDPVRLAQVFSNLLNNAAKYTEAGGTHLRCRASVDGGEVAHRRSRDTGIGIAPDACCRTCSTCSSRATSWPARHGGLGIGLTLVRSSSRCTAAASACSSDGPGAAASSWCACRCRRRAVAPAPARRRAASSCWRAARARGRRQRDAARCSRELLRLLGAEVRVAHDGAAALRAFDEFPPAVVFLDIGMPGMDGYEVAEPAAHARSRDSAAGRADRLGPGAGPPAHRRSRLRPPPGQAGRRAERAALGAGLARRAASAGGGCPRPRHGHRQAVDHRLEEGLVEAQLAAFASAAPAACR